MSEQVSRGAQEEIARFFREVLVEPIETSIPDMVSACIREDLAQARKQADVIANRLVELGDDVRTVRKGLDAARDTLSGLCSDLGDAKQELASTLEGSVLKAKQQCDALAAGIVDLRGQVTKAADACVRQADSSLQSLLSQVEHLSTQLADGRREASQAHKEESEAVLGAMTQLREQTERRLLDLVSASESRSTANGQRLSGLEAQLLAITTTSKKSAWITYSLLAATLTAAVADLCLRLFG